MRHTLPIFIVIIAIFIYSCANQISPTGGPKDTIPPTLLETYPENKSINYHGKKFTLRFDEMINTDKLKQHLIITPLTENNYEVKTKKNTVTITFEETFDSLTTYTLNFGDGITDITEKTPAFNLSLAFSTGPIIDSIQLKGNVVDLYNNEPLEKVVIAVYSITDTLNILTGKPRYFAKSDEEGNYSIDNIKNGLYRIYAFDDANNNMINNPEDEIHGFLQDPIDLNTSLENVNIRLQQLDTRPLQYNRSKFTGIYFDMTYNKYVAQYEVQILNNPKKLPLPKNNLITKNTSLRFYYDPAFRYEKDSLGIIVKAIDSLQNQTIDTTYVQFRSSKRKAESFSQNVLPKSKSKINPTINFKIVFDKPIVQSNLDSIRFQYDTLLYHFITDSLFIWNHNKTEFKFTAHLNPDTYKIHLDSLKRLHSDTTNKDTTELLIRKHLAKQDTLKVDFKIPKGAFISVENDTTTAINASYFFKKTDNYGSVGGSVTTTDSSYVLQLLTPKYDVIQQIKNPKQFNFKDVLPGKYTFRILLDNNNDGTWTYGNIQQNIEPESIYFYPETFDVRANWQIDNINIEF